MKIAASTDDSPPARAHPCTTATAVLLLIVILFGVVRALALRNDLWMDELWTLWHLSQLRSVGEVFSRFIHDNNHPLNTLWMYLVTPLKMDWAYRLLSWLGGTAGVWLAAKIARMQLLRLHPDASPGQAHAAEILTALLFGSSYLLSVYSSEARGYGPALGFGLLAVYALLRGATERMGPWVVVYWLASILAVLAHAVSYQLIAAAVGFTVSPGKDFPPRTVIRLGLVRVPQPALAACEQVNPGLAWEARRGATTIVWPFALDPSWSDD